MDAGGAPVPGGASFIFYSKRSADGLTLTDIVVRPAVTEEGDGFYTFLIADGTLLAGERLFFIMKNTVGADLNYIDGYFGAGAAISGDLDAEGLAEITLEVGDRAPSTLWVLRDQAGNPLDLRDGSPVVTFTLWPPNGGGAVVTDTPVAIVATNPNRVRIDWPQAATANANPDLQGRFKLVQNGLTSHHPVDRTIVVRVVPVAP